MTRHDGVKARYLLRDLGTSAADQRTQRCRKPAKVRHYRNTNISSVVPRHFHSFVILSSPIPYVMFLLRSGAGLPVTSPQGTSRPLQARGFLFQSLVFTAVQVSDFRELNRYVHDFYGHPRSPRERGKRGNVGSSKSYFTTKTPSLVSLSVTCYSPVRCIPRVRAV